MAWERVGNTLRCKEHGETFALARKCPQCKVPGRTARRRQAPSHPAPRAVAAELDSDLTTRIGRMEAAVRLYEQIGDTIPGKSGALQQPEMNAIKERRQILELLEAWQGAAELEERVAELEASNAELLERLEGAQVAAIEPPLIPEAAGVN